MQKNRHKWRGMKGNGEKRNNTSDSERDANVIIATSTWVNPG